MKYDIEGMGNLLSTRFSAPRLALQKALLLNWILLHNGMMLYTDLSVFSPSSDSALTEKGKEMSAELREKVRRGIERLSVVPMPDMHGALFGRVKWGCKANQGLVGCLTCGYYWLYYMALAFDFCSLNSGVSAPLASCLTINAVHYERIIMVTFPLISLPQTFEYTLGSKVQSQLFKVPSFLIT